MASTHRGKSEPGAQWALIKPGGPRNWRAIGVGPQGEWEMPPARFVILLSDENGFGLYHFAEDGEFAGDTLHPTRKQADSQMKFEFGSDAGPWRPIPPDIKTGDGLVHLVAYVRSQLPKTLNG